MNRSRCIRGFIVALALWPATLAGQAPVYKDANASIDARVKDLVGRMTIDEKFWQLFMIPWENDSTHDYSNGVFGLQVRRQGSPRAEAQKINDLQRFFVEKTRLGIPMLAFEETVHGLLQDSATVFPAAIGLAATWDTAIVNDVATVIAREAKTRGIRDGLSPVINIATDPRWGRVEETYGEDPVLSSRMAVAFVRGFEDNGVIATPKHFIANVGEGGRDSYPIEVSRRVLDEIHFPPFIAAIKEAGARSIMTSYNSYDGSPASQNHELIDGILKEQWKFGGFVISDQAAVGGATVLHHTEASTATATRDALDAGLDVIFQSSWPQYRPYLAAFKNGSIADSVIDAAVGRVLRAKFELGLFENPYVDPDSAEYWNNTEHAMAVARHAAREAIVLLKNDHNTLPLGPVRSVALIGPDAQDPRLGGYSGNPRSPVSIFSALKTRFGARVQLRAVRGVERVDTQFVTVPAARLSHVDSGKTVPGLKGEYFDNNTLSGAPRLVRVDQRVDFGWTLNGPGRGIPYDWYSVRWRGRITVPKEGVRRIGVWGNDGYRLYIDGRLALDDWKKQSFGANLAEVRLAPGSTHDIRLEYFESTGNVKLKLVWDAGVADDNETKIKAAVDAARQSDVAIVVAGIEEGEFRDRAMLGLPGHQQELIERVAATGKPTVVVLIGGSAITGGKWLDAAGAVMTAWYPGEQGGMAVADVLFGDYNPAGRLPMTWPVFEGQLPLVYNHKPTGRGDDYVDLTGQPLFPFGFGLSYTSFEYSDLSISPAQIGPNDTATVKLHVRNTGTRAGDEVVQLYVKDVLASVARPVIQLERFSRVHLNPGEAKELQFTLGPSQLQMLDRDLEWIVEPGTFRILVGASSKDIRLRGDLIVR